MAQEHVGRVAKEGGSAKCGFGQITFHLQIVIVARRGVNLLQLEVATRKAVTTFEQQADHVNVRGSFEMERWGQRYDVVQCAPLVLFFVFGGMHCCLHL